MSELFGEEFVPNEEASTNHKKWEQANPRGDAPKWRAFRDDVLAYKKGDVVDIPTMATPHGKALIAAGKQHMSVTDIGSPDYPDPAEVEFTTNITEGDTITTSPFAWTASTVPTATSMEFWVDGTLMSTDTTSPFSYSLALADGQHDLGLGAWHSGVRTLYDPNDLGRFARVTVATTPDPGVGTLYDQFSDFAPPWSNMLFLQRWQGTNWTGLADTGTAWSDGSGIFTVSTANGPGFRWYQGNAVPRASGAGVQMASHFKNGTFGDYTLTGYFMFPSATNPSFPNYADWNVIWEWVDGSHTIRNGIGVDTFAPGGTKVYVTTYKPGLGYHNDNLKVHAPTVLVKGQWYEFRWEIRLVKTSDGFSRLWIDDALVLNHSGATLSSDYGSKIWAQFGWYGGSTNSQNETQIASLRVA